MLHAARVRGCFSPLVLGAPFPWIWMRLPLTTLTSSSFQMHLKPRDSKMQKQQSNAGRAIRVKLWPFKTGEYGFMQSGKSSFKGQQ